MNPRNVGEIEFSVCPVSWSEAAFGDSHGISELWLGLNDDVSPHHSSRPHVYGRQSGLLLLRPVDESPLCSWAQIN